MIEGLLVVDVQPAYSEHCDSIARSVAQRINNTVKPTIIMWVGEGITDDTEESVMSYLHEHGARPGKLAQARFIEKDYGFFRPWMDSGVPPEAIVKVGKHLVERNINSSEDIDSELELDDDIDVCSDPMNLPSFDRNVLAPFSRFDTCGGGADQCLAEIELLLSIMDKPYKRIPSLIYG